CPGAVHRGEDRHGQSWLVQLTRPGPGGPGRGSATLMEMIAFRCVSCNHELRVGKERAGEEIDCPECGHSGRVPIPFHEREKQTHSPARGNEISPPNKNSSPCGTTR